MTYKQYKLLKNLHNMAPEMDEEQKYKLNDIDALVKSAGLTKEEVLTLSKELQQIGYVDLYQSSGYISLVRITYIGVVKKNNYLSNTFMSILRNLVIPAVVSVLCSLLIEYFKQ